MHPPPPPFRLVPVHRPVDHADGGRLLRPGQGGILGGRLLPHRAVDDPGPEAAGRGRDVHRGGWRQHPGLPELLGLPAGGTEEGTGLHQKAAEAWSVSTCCTGRGAEVATVFTLCTKVKLQIQLLRHTLVKVKVFIQIIYVIESKNMQVLKCTYVKDKKIYIFFMPIIK